MDEKHHTSLLNTLDAEDRARLRSCGGPLASAWQLASPSNPVEKLEDADYETTARALLGQDLAATDRRTCRCRRLTADNRQGEECCAALCSKARHAYLCATGGGLKTRSVAVERVYERIRQECGYQTDREVHVPAWDR